MKKYKGIVFFDYDGTLIDEVDGIFDLPDSAKEALLALRQNGYATCICSGRSKIFCEDVKDYFDGYVVGAGAHVEIDGEVIVNYEIPQQEIDEMCHVCNPKGIYLMLDGDEQSYVDDMDSKPYAFFKYVFGVRDHWMQPWFTSNRCIINKFTFMYDHEEDKDFIMNMYGSKYNCVKHIRYNFIDVTPKGIDKGTGIQEMLAYLQLPKEASYGFGDGDNDLPLVQNVGTACIMKRHYAGLEPYAAYITDTVKNDGIKKGLTWMGLI